jgi:hypothetical protein
MTYTSAFMKMTTPQAVSKSTILTSWVDSYATTVHVVLVDGLVRRSLLPYGCILEHNTMQGYITNIARGAIVSVNRVWTIHMQKEWHTVSKSGVEKRWTSRSTQAKVKALIRKIYARDVRMVTAVRREGGCSTDEASKLFTSNK